MERKRALPPTYFMISLVAVFILYFVLPVIHIIPFPWNLWGIPPLLIGIYFNLSADRAFKEAGTTVKPFEESGSLITAGVFRISRHPMYAGMVLTLLGIAILLGALTPFIVPLVFAILMETVFIRIEEQMMEDKFGQAYLDYENRVRKWL